MPQCVAGCMCALYTMFTSWQRRVCAVPVRVPAKDGMCVPLSTCAHQLDEVQGAVKTCLQACWCGVAQSQALYGSTAFPSASSMLDEAPLLHYTRDQSLTQVAMSEVLD